MQVSLNGVGENFRVDRAIITGQDPLKIFPHELVNKIFTHFNLATLGTVCCINNAWQQLGNTPNLWKIAIYKEIAFGNDKWAQYFGSDIIKDEVSGEDFNSLPVREFRTDLQKFKQIFPEKNTKDILMLVRLPKTLGGRLTVNKLGELAKKYFPNNNMGYRTTAIAITDQQGDLSIDHSQWVLMTKDIVPGSKYQSYDQQKKIVANLAENFLTNYQVPKLLESITCIFSQYFISETRLFSDNPWTFTRCQNNISGFQVIVGGFSETGLGITLHSCAHQDIGVAALRNFEKP